ncbi:hypothetical protein [Rhodopseudomonas palustris]|uniref:Uncharacterized protein n=1 Tax=Rhodopseudomonas palustris (strain BisB18) TaxID=316056 RepID=Q218R8_RHOPB
MEEPTKRTLAGVELVTIPVTEYAELLDCRRRLAELRAVQTRFERRCRSPIEHDSEVASFIADRLDRMTFADIRAECVARFGAARTPSRTAIHLYSVRVRGRLGRLATVPRDAG